jgi:hypothetical protein
LIGYIDQVVLNGAQALHSLEKWCRENSNIETLRSAIVSNASPAIVFVAGLNDEPMPTSDDTLAIAKKATRQQGKDAWKAAEAKKAADEKKSRRNSAQKRQPKVVVKAAQFVNEWIVGVHSAVLKKYDNKDRRRNLDTGEIFATVPELFVDATICVPNSATCKLIGQGGTDRARTLKPNDIRQLLPAAEYEVVLHIHCDLSLFQEQREGSSGFTLADFDKYAVNISDVEIGSPRVRFVGQDAMPTIYTTGISAILTLAKYGSVSVKNDVAKGRFRNAYVAENAVFRQQMRKLVKNANGDDGAATAAIVAYFDPLLPQINQKGFNPATIAQYWIDEAKKDK